jgi:two-component system, NtrC family, sensor histidine kinase PilS
VSIVGFMFLIKKLFMRVGTSIAPMSIAKPVPIRKSMLLLPQDNTLIHIETAWKALRYFNLYRIILSSLFVVLLWTNSLPSPFGGYQPRLFAVALGSYFVIAIIVQFAAEHRTIPYKIQVVGQVLFDILTITVLMSTSGGVNSGFGMLLVVSVAASSLLITGGTAIVLAAIASLAVLGSEIYALEHALVPKASFTQGGLLGATFFATALLSHALASRIRQSEALAAQRGVDLANMARLNAHIVQRMQSGIIVLDPERQVRLVNASALALLGLSGPCQGEHLARITPELYEHVCSWLKQPHPAARLMCPVSRETDLLISMADLGPGPSAGILIFLEDAAVTRQRAQQLKLASLGQLTASIAHEIRNPLGAISHAGQLLSESSSRPPEDQRLTRIIKEHSERINRIIENVLRLGRRDNPVPESFPLGPWLQSFVEEFTEYKRLSPVQITLNIEPADIEVRMDRSQLHQIVWNLCENGLRYSRGTPLLELQGGLKSISERPYLDVIDHGPGIPLDLADHIFEPFVSRNSTGTGLGLYIAGELCECNQASLSLHANTDQGCCFRINFAHPDRQQWVA